MSMKTDDLCLVETLKEIERRAVGARSRLINSIQWQVNYSLLGSFGFIAIALFTVSFSHLHYNVI